MDTSCAREWTREFMVNNLSKSWVNRQWKMCEEQLLYDKERALFPMAQEIAASQKRVDERKDLIKKIDEKIEQIKKERRKIVKEIDNIEYRIRNPTATVDYRGNPIQRQKFVKKCPLDNCRGYLSSQWKCGTCEIWCCPDCHEIKGLVRDAPHSCNPDTVATISALATETKNCPNTACGVPIYKIDGCDQMWCTTCHTAFSWRTGRIETTIHNPHYYEYMRSINNGVIQRNPLDNHCEQRNVLTHRTPTIISSMILEKTANITRQTDENIEKRNKFIQSLSRMIRYILHLRQIVLPNYRVNRVVDNLELRVKYINDEISEEKLKITLQRRKKLQAKKTEYFHIFDMVVNMSTDIIMRYQAYITEMEPTENIDDFTFENTTLKEMNPLIEYANECLCKIAKTYSSKKYVFTAELYIPL